jgi:DnaJ-class molecular chaperone
MIAVEIPFSQFGGGGANFGFGDIMDAFFGGGGARAPKPDAPRSRCTHSYRSRNWLKLASALIANSKLKRLLRATSASGNGCAARR